MKKLVFAGIVAIALAILFIVIVSGEKTVPDSKSEETASGSRPADNVAMKKASGVDIADADRGTAQSKPVAGAPGESTAILALSSPKTTPLRFMLLIERS